MNSIRRFGLIALAALAVTALTGVASASAAETEFRAESFPVTIKGSGNQEIGTTAGTISCPTSTQNGEAKSSATWWTVKVADSGCTIGGVAATVSWGECEIRYYTYSGLYIVCKGGVVKITSESCVVEIGPQEVESVGFTNLGSGTTRTIAAVVKVGGLKYTQSSKCAGGAGTKTNGTLGGEILLKGFTEKGVQQGIFIE
jgi:hypothetical protein